MQPARFALVSPLEEPLPPSESIDALSLSDVEAAAVAFHPVLRQAEGNVQAARGARWQAGLPPNPRVGYFGEEIGDDGTAGKQGGLVSQEFVTAGKLRLSRAVAARDVAAAEQEVEQMRLALLTTTRIYFFEAIAAQRELALAGQLEQLASQLVEASDMRYRAEEGSKASLLQSQVEFDNTALLVVQARQRRQAAWRRLASITGLDPLEPQRLDDVLGDPLPAIEWVTARERLLSASPELAELYYRVERAQWAVQRARAGRVPNVTVQGVVAKDNVSGDAIANVQISMPLPIYNRNQGNRAKAFGELTAAQAALEERELALTQRLADAVAEYETARLRAERFDKTILPTAQESLDLIRQAYEHGEVDYIQLLAMQRTFTENSLRRLDALKTAWQQWAEIEGMLVGRLDQGGR